MKWIAEPDTNLSDDKFDVMAVALHEIGHTIGLLHNPDDTSIVMFPSYRGRRTLHDDDLAGALFLYGEPLFELLPAQDRAERGWSNYKTLVGDVDNDGKSDLIWNETADTNRIYVGLSNGDGTFPFLLGQQRTERGWDRYKTLVGDVNGDGRSDLIWNYTEDFNRTYVGLGNADGTFTFLPGQDRAEQKWQQFKTLVGDVNGDGRSDLIWNYTEDINRTYVGLGNADGTFTFLPGQDRAERGWSNYKTLVGDVNGDGRSDLIWNYTEDINRTYVGLSNGDGTFNMRPAQDRTERRWLNFKTLVGDVNNDGKSDLIWNYTEDINRTYIGLSNGDGTLNMRPAQDRTERRWSNFKTLVGDIDGNGRSDLIWNFTDDINRVYVGVPKEDGTFIFRRFQDRDERRWHNFKTLVGDVDGDGRSDLIWNYTEDINRVYVGLSDF
ncbi:VCBS repeat-containing protein [Chloroflexi bacterium TSY]|nr:VCBS repeat-containing protein [Chloroflexi bacterium TSY]